MHLLESRLPLRSVTVMVQRESAQRLWPPGERAAGRQRRRLVFAEPKLCIRSRGSFLPAPSVDSAVTVSTTAPRPAVAVGDEALFF
jgi:16S rRNA (adenine1518-N6/adenine1519-N6)-dimethyltransferase